VSLTEVFVLGLDEVNLAQLHAVPGSEQYRYHSLLSVPELQEGELPIADLLQKAREQLGPFEGHIGAIVGFWDFPVSSMVPMLCAEFGVPGAPLRPIVTCEHKYWSRLEQRKVIDEVPAFALVDLDTATGPPQGLRYPLWLKPIKGFSSELAFQVNDDDEFAEALTELRAGVDRVDEPFRYVLEQLDLPPEIAEIDPHTCLAEEAIHGNQVATEGYVYRGQVHVYGVLDSIDYPDSSAFLRHQYPSQLPARTQRRLIELSRKVIEQVGLDNSTFSVEFFHDPESDSVNVLEINPRHSQSHAALFNLVDGVPNHHVMLQLALAQDPTFGQGQGPYDIAAKCYPRRFSDGIVRRVPTREELDQLSHDLPGVSATPVPTQDQRLSEMVAQDSYSYELAEIVVGARDVTELEDKYQRAVDALRFEIDDIEEHNGGTDTGNAEEATEQS
jgi:hypothetical protein